MPTAFHNIRWTNLPATDAACDEILTLFGKSANVCPGGKMASTTYYVALPFVASEDGPTPSEAVECQSSSLAKATARTFSQNSKYVGSIAFRRTGDPDEGDFCDAEIIERYGDTPNDLSAL